MSISINIYLIKENRDHADKHMMFRKIKELCESACVDTPEVVLNYFYDLKSPALNCEEIAKLFPSGIETHVLPKNCLIEYDDDGNGIYHYINIQKLIDRFGHDLAFVVFEQS